MSMLIVLCIAVVGFITAMFLIAVNWGYKVKQTVYEVSYHPNPIDSKGENNQNEVKI